MTDSDRLDRMEKLLETMAIRQEAALSLLYKLSPAPTDMILEVASHVNLSCNRGKRRIKMNKKQEVSNG